LKRLNKFEDRVISPNTLLKESEREGEELITFQNEKKQKHHNVIATPTFDSRDYMHLTKKKNIPKFAKTEMSDEDEKEEINLRGNIVAYSRFG
jgi:hypothetical protein